MEPVRYYGKKSESLSIDYFHSRPLQKSDVTSSDDAPIFFMNGIDIHDIMKESNQSTSYFSKYSKAKTQIDTAKKALDLINEILGKDSQSNFKEAIDTQIAIIDHALVSLQKKIERLTLPVCKDTEEFYETFKSKVVECNLQIGSAYAKARELQTRIKAYKDIRMENAFRYDKCREWLKSYQELCPYIWQVRQVFEPPLKSLESTVDYYTIHKHSRHAINTNIKLGYVSSAKEDEMDLQDMETLRLAYTSLLESCQKLLPESWKALPEIVQEIHSRINTLCYDYEYEKRYSTGPSKVVRTIEGITGADIYNISDTVINPFKNKSCSGEKIILESKALIYFPEENKRI
jgi:hypothetical protein